MVAPFNLRGYRGDDPLDRLTTTQRFILTSVLGFAFTYAMLILVVDVFNIAQLQYRWLLELQSVGYALIYIPIVVALRKSSTLIHIGLLVAMMLPFDFMVQAQFRDAGHMALWIYPADGPLGGMAPLVQFLIVFIGDAIAVAIPTLFLGRVIANWWKPLSKEDKAGIPTEAQQEALFSKWSEKIGAFEKRDVSFYILRAVGLVYFAYLGLVLLGALGSTPYPEPLATMIRMSYENVMLAINTYIKLVLMAVLAMVGAYNRELRYHTALALLVGHMMSTVSSLFFYLYDPVGTPYRDFLLTSAIVDTVLGAAFVFVMIKHKADAHRYAIQKEFPEFYSIGNRLTVNFFLIFGAATAAIVATVVALRLFADPSNGWGAVYGFPDPQICNTLTKYTTLSFLAFLIARREKLRRKLYSVILSAYSTSVVMSIAWAMAAMFIQIDVATRTGGTTQLDWYLMLNVAMDGGIVFLLVGLRRMYYNMEYSVSSLTPASAQNVMALHKALYDTDDEMHGAVLQAIDQHSANVRGRKRGLLNFPFLLLEFLPGIFSLKPVFFTMSKAERLRILKKQILRKPSERARSFSPELADILFKIGNAGHALVTLAHYNHIRSRETTGYIPPDARDRLQSDIALAPPPFDRVAELPDMPHVPANYKDPIPTNVNLPAPRLTTPVREPEMPKEVDYCIIGSGAGGAVMAYRLAQKEPNARIVVIERGPRYSPLQDFNDNEMEMVRKLYKEGGLQQTKRFDLMILQGECMGGTTVINNSVCFPMPDKIKQRWENEFGLDMSSLDQEYQRIAQEIDIHEIDAISINQRVERVFRQAVSGMPPEAGLRSEPLLANQSNMMGEGLCNLGNKRMRKRSMLETYIPWAEARGVEFISETSAVRFYNEGPRVTGVLLRSDLGQFNRVKINKALVVAGGVIASSHFLMRSGVTRNVGERMSCNFAFPLAFEFDEELKAYDGTQITVGALDPSNRAVFETYMNPPGSFSISLPFYFDEHARSMSRYSNTVNFGALVGSEANGRIEAKADILNGRAFTWELGKTDKENIKYALSTLVLLGKHSGAKQAIVPMEPGLKIDLRNGDADKFVAALRDYPIRISDLRLTTAHPQGGNGMAATVSTAKTRRVVNEDFQVEGFENLYIADASVFPTGITVNPQWTIMALSSMAADRVAATRSVSASVAWPPRSTSSLTWLFNTQRKERVS
ncbi:MAG TPA: FAD-dependent oxidoreductase [Candidatus Kapabacteria bacterium]|nr:FAD-dependent oxidoreductase [Candidatus Kapabacteria bacterium]